MAVVTGTHNTANAATTFFGNGSGSGTIDTALLAAGWKFIENVAAVTAGTTAAVDVYRLPSGDNLRDIYMFVELDNTNARMRFRAAEGYNKVWTATLASSDAGDSFKFTYGPSTSAAVVTGTNCTAAAIQALLRTLTGDSLLTVTGTTDIGPFTITFYQDFCQIYDSIGKSNETGMTVTMTSDHKLIRPCYGGTQTGAVVPTITDTVTNTPSTIHTATTVGYVECPIANSAAVGYLYKTSDTDLFFLGLRSGAANSFVILGRYTKLEPTTYNESVGQAFIPLFLQGRDGNTSWVDTAYSCRLSRARAVGAVSTAGCFNAAFDYPGPVGITSSAATAPDFFNRINGGTATKGYTNPIVSDAVLHGAGIGVVGLGRDILKGYLPNVVVGTYSSEPSGGGNDTLNVDGTTYYVLGANRTGSVPVLLAVK